MADLKGRTIASSYDDVLTKGPGTSIQDGDGITIIPSIVDGFAGGTSAPGSAENDKVLNERKVQMVTLLQGNGATDNRRWYRIAEFLRSQGNEIHFSVHNADRIAAGTDSEIYTFCVRNSVSTTPDVQYSKTGVAGIFPGRVVITDDGTNIGVYVRVGRYGNATVASSQFIIDRNINSDLEATEIGQGTAVPASISADVVFDTDSDAPNATIELGDVVVGGVSLRGEPGLWTPTDSSGAGLTLTNTGCNYYRLGDLYFVQFSVTYPSTADNSLATLGSTPANPNSGPSYLYGGRIHLIDNNPSDVAGATVLVHSTGNRFFFKQNGSFLLNSDLSALNIRGFAIYIGD